MSRFAILIFATIWATAAYAQPAANDPVARQHYERGKQLADDRNYAAAYAEFSAGFDTSPRPQFLFNMAECERALGNLDQARALYERFVAASPNDPLAAKAHSRLAELPAPAPEAAPPVVTPSQTAPTVPSSAVATPAPVAAVSTTPPAAANAAAPSPRSHTGSIAFGLGALAAGGGAVALDLVGDATYARAQAEKDMARQKSLWNSADTLRYTAVGVGVAGVASAGVAVWLLLRSDHRDHDTSAHRVHLVPTTNGVALLGAY
jgi:tetratricopeptide (TPR) repeat protein